MARVPIIGQVNAPEPPPGPLAVAANHAIRAIDRRDYLQEQALTSSLLRAAWPTLRAQNQ